MSSDNIAVVSAFIHAWSRLDASELANFFNEDGIYHNMPARPVAGREQIKLFIESFIQQWTETDWLIVNIAESGNTVFVERLDKTKTLQGNVDLPCTGVFEMKGGKIQQWRDYFDLATYRNAMAGQ
ncbi:MAG: nuclear transport factor 2 family protein [Gammaproteobacteria bacterium]|nr:nuclear transport factor 2 family protein [Gammaproteobacteria bacterium]